MKYTDLLQTDSTSLDALPQIVTPLLAWYDAKARELPWRQNPNPYWIWVSEIMLQQTRVQAVLGYFDRFIKELPTIKALAAVPEERLLKLWEGLGYYNRARNLQKAAKLVCAEYDGILPPEYEALLKLPGIGEYTAGAMASTAFGLAIPAIDGNVYRVISRLLASYTMINTGVAVKRAYFYTVANIIPKNRPGDFNQALMELGATVCLPTGAPACHECPINTYCKAYQVGVQQELPLRPSKKPRTIEERSIIVITSPQGILLTQRPSKGLLASLWEPINLWGKLTDAQVKLYLKEQNIAVESLKPLGDATHIFSHIEWRMKGWHVVAKKGPLPKEYAWVHDLSHHSIPSAFNAYTKEITL